MGISTAVDNSVIARVLGIEARPGNFNAGRVFFLPQRVALVGQGNTAATYPTTKRIVTSAGEVASMYGFGSPLHLAAMQLLPANNDGLRSIPLTVFPLDDNSSGVAAVGEIGISGTVTAQRSFVITVSGQRSGFVTVPADTTAVQAAVLVAAAINGNLNMPVTAAVDGTEDTQVNLTAKWQGTSGNDLSVSMSGPTDSGLTLAFTQPVGGAANPTVDDALEQIGLVWETLVVNCLSVTDTVALDAYDDYADGRWNPLTRRPLTVYTGTASTDRNALITLGDARRARRGNVIESAPGSVSLPCQIAAAAVARIARVANNNPARDYARNTMPFIEPGLDSQQWSHTERDLLVKAGISTTIVRDGVVELSDTVTTFHPTGDQLPGFRFVKDVTKEANVLFNLDLIFNTQTWDGAPLIPDDQPTSNPDAKRPKDAVAVVYTLARNLALQAIISDLPFTAEGLRASISDQNPNRLDILFPHKVSGNVNVTSIDSVFGFFLGTQEVIA